MPTEQEDTLFTKTNPVRDRRTYLPNLEIQNFDLSTDDLDLCLMQEKLLVLVQLR